MPRVVRVTLSMSTALLSLVFVAALVVLLGQSPIVAAASQAKVIYVDLSASGSATGLSWKDAFTRLQDGLAAAQSGDEVWVAAGVYTPGKARDNTFQLKNGVALYGGFTGAETAREQRDWQVNVTVLSGDIDHNDGVDAHGVVTDTTQIAGENAFTVLTGGGDASTIVDGFVVTAGKGGFGGGMNNSNSSPTLVRIIFSGNQASFGGGMYNSQSSPSLTDVTFRGNFASFGGGMANDLSNPVLDHVIFDDNFAGFGGGMRNNDSSPTLTHVTFVHNTGTFGGGMRNTNSSHPVLTDVNFRGNLATASGGGINNADLSSLQITNGLFSGNRAGSDGGGMYNSDGSQPTLTNVTFSGNRAGAKGGGMMNYKSTPTIQNSIFWDNQDISNGGTSASLANQEITPTIRYSLVQGCKPGGAWQISCGIDGGHNLSDADPRFVTPVDPLQAPSTAGDLHLWASSPAINTGDNSATSTATDLDGKPRIFDGAVDLGAYEFQGGAVPSQDLFLPVVQK